MRIQIDHKLISDSPFTSDNKEVFIFENEEDINQIRNKIIYGNPTSFLVSGFRGSGKTSVMKKIEDDLKSQKNIAFVYLSFPNYEQYPTVLRKTIRQIYLTLKTTDLLKNLRKKDKKIYDDIELLYKRTFFKVTRYSNRNKMDSSQTEIKFDFSILDYLLIILLVIFSINLGSKSVSSLIFPIVKFDASIIDGLLFITTIILFSINAFGIKFIKKYLYEKNTGVNITEFYDDELAEHNLIEILKKLNENQIKIIFVFDELDKIEDPKDINLFFTNIKPLMFSGLAGFLLICGQDICYKVQNDQKFDDPKIGNLFSTMIHIPLLSPNVFHKIFEKITLEGYDNSNKGIFFYIDSLILKSKRIPRRFFNLIREDLIWEKDKTYIEIDNEKVAEYETDSKLLNIIRKIEEDEILATGYSGAERDFFVMRLHDWIQLIKEKKGLSFSSDEIFDPLKDCLNYFPQEFNSQVKDWCDSLLEKMAEKNLLTIVSQDEETKKVLYAWSTTVEVEQESTERYDESRSITIDQLIGLEKFLNDIINNYSYFLGER